MKFVYVIIITLLFLGFFIIDSKQNEIELSVLYNNNIVTVKILEQDYNNLKLKSENDVLFFDGEYFFEDAPNNKTFKAKIVNVKVIEYPSKGLYFCFVVLMLIILATINPESIDKHS